MSSHTEELWYNETVCLWMTIYMLPHGIWALWQRNLRLPLACCKALWTNWALWYLVRQKCKQAKAYNSWADIVCLLAERYDTKSNVKLGGFWSQLQASSVCSHTEELCYNEAVCLWMTIYIYISSIIDIEHYLIILQYLVLH